MCKQIFGGATVLVDAAIARQRHHPEGLAVINLAPWHDVLIASSAAAATLAGLILTAMAVNIDAILKYPSLPPRAGSAIGSLVYVLVLNVAALIPGVTLVELGWITVVVLLAPLAVQVDVMVRQLQIRPKQSFARLWSKIALGVAQIAPFIVSGVLLLEASQLGLTWMIIGSLAVFICAVANAWVLLVEIRR